MNQGAYISASLRFLASTIISCNSTDTSSERIREREGEKRGVREEIIGKQRKLQDYSQARIDRNKGYAVSTGGSAAQADKSFCNQRYSERQFAPPPDQFFCTHNHDESSTALFYCLLLDKDPKRLAVIIG